MNGQFKEVHYRLDKIELQTTRTNGNVTHLEKEMEEEKRDLLEHALSCPKGIEIQEIHDAMVEGKGVKIGKTEASTKGQVAFSNIISIAGTLLVIIGLIVTVITSKRADEVLQQKINDLGTPVIVNDRGAVVPLQKGDSLKFYRDGEFKEGLRDSNK